MKENLETEVKSLKEQLQLLQAIVSTMQQETEKKELSFGKLKKEKEKLENENKKLINHLQREKHSRMDIQKQLENERNYYFEAKESYTYQMNEARKLKRKLSAKNSNILINNLEEKVASLKLEIKQLKEALRETLEANYNLSVRFLRMKSTKTQFKQKLKKLQEDQAKTSLELETKICLLNKELNFIVDNKFKTSISPSNRRHLMLIKQNGNLLHENFCLQMEVERLTEKLSKMHETFVKYNLKNRIKSNSTKSDPFCQEKHQNKIMEDTSKSNLTKNYINYKTVSENLKKTENNKSLLDFKISIKNGDGFNKTEAQNISPKQIECKLLKNNNRNEKSLIKKINFDNDLKLKKVEKQPELIINKYENKRDNSIKNESKKYSHFVLPIKTENSSNFNEESLLLKQPDMLKSFDSDGLDFFQISEVHSKESFKTEESLLEKTNFDRKKTNFYSKNGLTRTKSCPDIFKWK